jgi:uncharacterized membrane protein (DUF373 family)
MKTADPSSLEKKLLGYLKIIGVHFNYLLAGALIIVALFAIGLFGYDIYLLFTGQTTVEKGILTTLGSLLILWAAIELIDEEINHLRGGHSALAAFVALAIATLIRKILIVSLSPEKAKEILMYGLLVLCLSIAYWLIAQTAKSIKTKMN